MKYLNLLIKPSSSLCNIKCDYCFYNDIETNRSHGNFGLMTSDTMEKLLQEVFSLVTDSITFTFQGGEPTLIGVNFYKIFHKLVKKYNRNNITTHFSIQTNGTKLDDSWVELFLSHNYLVGISLDGTKEVHNFFRKDKLGNGTFNKIFRNIKLLEKNKINFNILSVVNKKTVEEAENIYNFFKESNFKYLQFIPCLDNLNNSKGNYSLEGNDYGRFLDIIFNLWYKDLVKNNYISIRYFENLVSLILGRRPESCDMNGFCSITPVVESNGNIYPCDFYTLDEFLLGNILTAPFEEILKSEKSYNFIKSSVLENPKCKECNFFTLCRSGCRRHKDFINGNYENRFCTSYEYFFSRNINKLIEISKYFN